MKICEINPYIRFAEKIDIKRKPSMFNVFDNRIFYVTSGTMKISIDNCQYELKEKDLFYCMSGSCYSISNEEVCSLISLNFDLSQARSNITEHRNPYKMHQNSNKLYEKNLVIDDADILNSHCIVRNMDVIRASMEQIVTEFSTREIFFEEKSSAILKDIIIEIYRYWLGRNDNVSDSIKTIVSYITRNYMENIKNSHLSELVGYHEYYINRVFKKYMGVTIHKYILGIRLAEAKKLLVRSNMTLYTIAIETGFNSETHLSTAFKKEFGYSPMEYSVKFKNRI